MKHLSIGDEIVIAEDKNHGIATIVAMDAHNLYAISHFVIPKKNDSTSKQSIYGSSGKEYPLNQLFMIDLPKDPDLKDGYSMSVFIMDKETFKAGATFDQSFSAYDLVLQYDGVLQNIKIIKNRHGKHMLDLPVGMLEALLKNPSGGLIWQ